MSVTAGSLGTADVPVSNPSLDGLDRVNFFLAAMLAGFGPYVAAYLANAKWPQAEIGLVLSAGSVAALLSQLPGGEVLDKVRSKRAIFPFADMRYEVTLSSGCFGLDAMLRAIICGLAKGKTSRTQHDDVPNGHDLPPFMSPVINRW